VFENRVLRRISGPKREEVAGDWRRLHNEELHKLYALPNIIWKDKMGSVYSMHGDLKVCTEIWSEKLKAKGHSEDLGVDGRIVLE
jgi:hypothetical protein